MSTPEELLMLFQSMGTTDHDTLVQQFMQIVSSEDADSCRFFLEANNWNLQSAIASYYDAGSTYAIEQQRHPPEMTLIADVTVDNKEYMAPGTPFRQTWRIRNPAMYEAWPDEVWLVWVQGDRLPGPQGVRVPALGPGQDTDLTIALTAPAAPGNYAAAYRLCTHDGFQMYFGEAMWVVLNVVEPGARNHIQDAVEQERLRKQEEHQLEDLIGSFSHMKPATQGLGQGSSMFGMPHNDNAME